MARGGVPRRAAGSRAPQRQFVWNNVLISASTVGNSNTKTTGNQYALGAEAGGGVTLIRTRGTGVIHMDPGAISDMIFVGIGLCIVTVDAFAIGATAMPGPLTDIDFDWWWHSIFALGPVAVATELENSIIGNVRFEIDSKAMRKIKPNETLAFMMEGQQEGGTPTYDASVAVRTLFKLG